MSYFCNEYGISVEMKKEHFYALNDASKMKILGMNEQQVKMVLFLFVEVLGESLGRRIQVFYICKCPPIMADIFECQDAFIENMKESDPSLHLESHSILFPTFIQKCVWKKGDITHIHYITPVNGHMVCVLGDVSVENDDLDEAMKAVAMSLQPIKNN